MSQLQAELNRAHIARRGMWKSKSVADDGFDLKRPKRGAVIRMMPWAPETMVQAMQPYVTTPVPTLQEKPRSAIVFLPPLPHDDPTLKPTIKTIQQRVCREYGISRADMIGPARTRNLVRARQVAMYLCRVVLPEFYTQADRQYSLPAIGRHFGGRDHTTVISAIRRINRLIGGDAVAAARIEAMRLELMLGSFVTAEAFDDMD